MRLSDRMGRQTWAAILLAAASFIAPAALAAQEPPPWASYAAPQQLVRLADGRRMNVTCMGEGAPVVILESGSGDTAGIWGYVQSKLAHTTRTCAYDRAGLGFSDEGPGPRDAAAEASDLQAMLEASGLKGPYVFVGHSLGSYVVRLFADLHPRQVAGMVLVDPSVEYQNTRQLAVAPGLRKLLQDASDQAHRCAALAEAGELKPGTEAYKDCVPGPPPDLPPDLVTAFLAPYARPANYRTLASERDTFGDRSSAELAANRRSYGDMPLIVLTAGEHPKLPTMTDAENQALAALWNQMHDELAALSSRGENRRVEGSGHYIQLVRPQVVIDAVNEVVADVRQRAAAIGR